jgi:hypothetical protein
MKRNSFYAGFNGGSTRVKWSRPLAPPLGHKLETSVLSLGNPPHEATSHEDVRYIGFVGNCSPAAEDIYISVLATT